MRFSVVALGLAVIGSQFGGPYARALLRDAALAGPDLVDRDTVEKGTQVVREAQSNPDINRPRNVEPTLAVPETPAVDLLKRAKVKAKKPKPTTAKAPAKTPAKQTPVKATPTPSEKPYPGQKPPSPKVAKFSIAKAVKAVLVKASSAPKKIKFKAPKKNQKKKPLPKTTKPKSLDEVLNSSTAKEKADTVKWKIPGNKAAAKRELEEITKRSGDEHAITWAQWQQVLQLVDAQLVANRRITHPVIIYCYGGVSSLQLGLRGPNGVSADLDFHHVEATPTAVRDALDEAIAAVYDANQNLLEDDFMNQAITIFMNAQSRAANAQEATHFLFRGTRLWVLHGPFGVSLAGKMDKIANQMKHGEPEVKNVQDAVGFLQQAVVVNGGRPVDRAQVARWSRLFGKDSKTTKRNINWTVRYIQQTLPQGAVGFSDQLLEEADVENSSGSN